MILWIRNLSRAQLGDSYAPCGIYWVTWGYSAGSWADVDKKTHESFSYTPDHLVTTLHVVTACVPLDSLAASLKFLCGEPGLLETKAANPFKD